MHKPPNAQPRPNPRRWPHLLLPPLLTLWLAGCATPQQPTYLPPEQRLKAPELQPPVAPRLMPPICANGCSNGVKALLDELEANWSEWLRMLVPSKATTQPAGGTTKP